MISANVSSSFLFQLPQLLVEVQGLLPKPQQLPAFLAKTHGKPKIASEKRKMDTVTKQKLKMAARKLVKDAKVCSFGHEILVMVFFDLL